MNDTQNHLAESAPKATDAWRERWPKKVKDARRAFRAVKRGQRIFIGSACGEPQHLVRALEENLPNLADMEILHILSLGTHTFLEENYHGKCRLKSFFVAAASRKAVAEGRADYTPINLGDVPGLFRSGALPIDVALIQVSPPDEHGFCSLGISVDIVKAAAESAKTVIAQVNSHMPRTLGDSFIHVDEIDVLIPWDEPLLEMHPSPITPEASAIGVQAAKLIEDGSTIRVGVGSIPSAVLYALEDKKDLGVHTDMLTDAYLHLVEKGVITNAKKTLHPGKIVASFCIGTRALFNFVHNNPMVALHPAEYTNNYLVISQNDRMVSVNSALEIDLTGQVCSDSMGYRIYSGVGGSVDFLRGARNSRGGKTITVLTSLTQDGRSRIVPTLTPGGGVVITRGGVQFVVTEYGIAQLQGKSLRERALALIGIAHPDFREELTRHAYSIQLLKREQFAIRAAKAIYPEELEITQVFDETTKVFFRPAKPTDERMLREFFYSLPKDEAYIRFLSTMKVYPQVDIHRLVNIDYDKEMTLVGVVGHMEEQRIVAVGRFIADEESPGAEVDFAVHPDYGRRGIASFMIQYLSEIAIKSGIRQFRAYIRPGNERVFGIFQRLGYFVETSNMEGFYEIRVHFDKPVDVCLTEVAS
ncbi:GNAT family N-acetyltransferase [Desulfosoma caldarium]|uniref:Acyl-CoA hydrolase n=1 Tax=Desulfosoma caldarium TaxID=610254 RepID=A0A3N1ULV4_9BACT|nr:GNAT family N-acetyltransferase [Desulfosoma caldarium]ROQ91073.1 acyl-CoA hydrolase [Desulfosoma caldarium]